MKWKLLSWLLGCTLVMFGQADGPVAIRVDAGVARHAISPYIYGVAFARAKALQDLNSPVNRAGGNSASLYNWELNARNAGRDWFFESLSCANEPLQQFGDGIVQQSRLGKAQAMLTIPLIGWVAKLGPDNSKLASFSVLKYGVQQKTDEEGMPDAGNGFDPEGKPISGNNPHDAAMADDVDRESLWLKHLVSRWNTAASGGVAFYLLDNEMSRWHDVHRDVHPQGAHASEIAFKTISYSKMIKRIDPTAMVAGPEEFGWLGYFESGFDQQLAERGDKLTTSDRVRETHGMDFVPWLLSQWKQAGRPVDIFSLHFYPHSGEYKDGGDDVSEAMQLIRNRSTRLLWDRGYRDNSWIKEPVALIPRMRDWVDRSYHPGTPLALTEYNWGGEKTMNGATTQADLLGIFGREGLYLATRWVVPDEGTPTYLAFKLFRNYDGENRGFGETSVAAQAPDPDKVSTFAALRKEDQALTVVVINKQLHQSAAVDVSVNNFAASGSLDTVRLERGELSRLPDAKYAKSVYHAVIPAKSVTMFIFHPSSN